MKAINLDGHNEYNIEEVDGDYFIYKDYNIKIGEFKEL